MRMIFERLGVAVGTVKEEVETRAKLSKASLGKTRLSRALANIPKYTKSKARARVSFFESWSTTLYNASRNSNYV